MFRRHFLFLIVAAVSAELFGGLARAADTTLAENVAATKPAATEAAPHIALLLPLNANGFRQPAEIVRQGFLAAAKAQPDTPPIRIYPTTDDVGDVLTVYTQALSQGARVVVGPLTRNAVTTLATSDRVVVPTLSLSTPDQDKLSIPPQLYLFGLSIEEEARQVAQMAMQDGYRRPLVVAAETSLAKRMEAAFSEQWQKLGGLPVSHLRFGAGKDPSGLRGLVEKADADMIFLAANAQESRGVRPYLASTLPTYATSQVFAGRTQDPRNVDLGGIRFIDMPWLLEPDHPAVMVYPHSETVIGAEFERLYALGIDALRLASTLYRDKTLSSTTAIDGVTGRLTLGRDHVIQRELLSAEFQQDSVVVIDAKP